MANQKQVQRKVYGKWDSPEDESIAFEMVRTGRWDLVRFRAWCSQVQVETWRDATADEGL